MQTIVKYVMVIEIYDAIQFTQNYILVYLVLIKMISLLKAN